MFEAFYLIHHVQSLACYFPVDFTPPSGVVASVTKEQLQQGLRQAITHPSLTSWTLSLLIEKLDSDLESAKLDCLETLLVLSEKCEERRQEVIEDWVKELPDLWTGLKRELMGLRMGEAVHMYTECTHNRFHSRRQHTGDQAGLGGRDPGQQTAGLQPRRGQGRRERGGLGQVVGASLERLQVSFIFLVCDFIVF